MVERRGRDLPRKRSLIRGGVAPRPFKPCFLPGCSALTQSTYCSTHATAPVQKRDSAARRGYGRRWRVAAAQFLLANPICSRCGQPATCVDHLTPHRGNPYRFWDQANWQPFCARCHSSKTAREDGGFGHPIHREQEATNHTRREAGDRTPVGILRAQLE